MNTDVETLSRLAELRARNEQLRRARALREAYGLHFYRPHWKQHLFHAAGHKKGRYGRTGNRFGKSEMGSAEDVAWCLGGRVWYKKPFDIYGTESRNGVTVPVLKHRHEGGDNHPLVRHGIPDHPVKGLILCVDWDKASEIFTNRRGSAERMGKLFRLIPHEAIGNVHTSRGGHIDQITIKRLPEAGGGESVLYIDTIQSFKQSKLSAESSDWDFIHVDEPCPKELFDAHARGLMDRNGHYWFTCTPLDEMWINDFFCPPGQNSINEAKDGREWEKKFIITGSIHDNPHMKQEAIEEFMSSLTREERACRENGLPLAMAGLVYKEFIFDLHVLCDVPKGWDDFHLPPKDHTIRVWWDYHTRLPQAVLFFATDPKGRVFVYDELFDDNLINPVAKAILRKTEGYNVVQKEIDPYALIRNPVDDTCIQDTLMEYGLWFEPATKDLTRGIHKVRERLLEREPTGGPTIFFSPRCAQTLWEFSHYVYDLKKNEPKDENNHMMENLYRAALSGLPYVDAKTSAPVRKVRVDFDEDRRSLFDHNLLSV